MPLPVFLVLHGAEIPDFPFCERNSLSLKYLVLDFSLPKWYNIIGCPISATYGALFFITEARKMLDFTPAVFAIGESYDIITYSAAESMIWIKVADELYYDDSNGIFRSLRPVHKITVPKSALDAAGEYTVYQKRLIERKPYFTETEETEEFTYSFRPVPENPRCYHISDAHNRIEQPCRAARAFGKIDFLVMNGDIPDHCGDLINLKNIYKIADELTKGEIPIVFSRGNHDMRGTYAEEFASYTPSDNGRSYFTVRLGNLWALILDCAEDKADSSIEYGYTVCCHSFRQKQTRFIEKTISRKGEEYDAAGVDHKIIISHKPFTHVQQPPFDIEQDIYSLWAKYCREDIRPDLYLAGHLHRLTICPIGGELDDLGQGAPLIVGATISRENDYFAGTGIEFTKDGVFATFTDSDGKVGERTKI